MQTFLFNFENIFDMPITLQSFLAYNSSSDTEGSLSQVNFLSGNLVVIVAFVRKKKKMNNFVSDD
jgi:hypothetical protein